MTERIIPTFDQEIMNIKGSFRVPYEVLEEVFSKFSRAELFALAKIFTYSHVKNQPTARCRSKMSEFASDLRISERHSSRLINRLLKSEYIEKVEDEDGKVIRSWYRFVGGAFCKGYIRVDLSNVQTKFKFKADTRGHNEPYERFLTLSEVLVLSYIVTHCDNLKRKKNEFSGSYRSIAKKLRLSPSTVSDAIYYLLHAELIFLPEEDRAVNGNGWCTYHANRALLKKTKEAYQKECEEEERRRADEVRARNEVGAIGHVSPAVAAVNASADRDRYYADLQRKANAPAEQMFERLKNDVEYSKANKEQRQAELDAVKAEVAGDIRATKNHKEKARYWTRVMRMRMEKLGILPEDLKPRYRCAKCSDTGCMPDGRYCDCYPKDGDSP